MAKKRSPVKIILVTLLIVVVAYAGVLGVSGKRIYDDTKEAMIVYDKFEACMDDFDIHGATDALRELANKVDEVNEEANAWQWQMASALPVLGDDVVCVQGLSAVANSLANDILTPTLDKNQDLLDGIAAVDFSNFTFADAGKVAKLVLRFGIRIGKFRQSLKEAREVLAECRTRLEALPVSHFDQVNEAKGKMSKAVEETDDTIVQIDEILAILDKAK